MESDADRPEAPVTNGHRRHPRRAALPATGVGVALGAGLGVALGVALAGGSGIAAGLLIGAAAGVVIGAVADALRPQNRRGGNDDDTERRP